MSMEDFIPISRNFIINCIMIPSTLLLSSFKPIWLLQARESGHFHGGPSQLSKFVFHLNHSRLYNAAAIKSYTSTAMDRRRLSGRGFKEEPVFDDEELVEGDDDDDDDDADEDYDVDSLLNMRPGDYGCGRSVTLSAPFAHESGSSSSTGWMPVPQHQLPPRAPQPLSICQVENCMADMSNAKQYHRRHKVCELHAKAQIAVVAGLQQRFCQQCSRFHLVSEFDETKRSCRRRLAGHNQRRRKSSYDYPSG